MKKPKNDCERYIAKKAKNCKQTDDYGVSGYEACPVMCEECEAGDEYEDESEDYVECEECDCGDATDGGCDEYAEQIEELEAEVEARDEEISDLSKELEENAEYIDCLLYTSPSPRDRG